VNRERNPGGLAQGPPPAPVPAPALPSRRERLGRAVGKRLWVLTALSLCASLAAAFAPLHWVLENAGEFQLQLLLAESPLAIAWLALPSLRMIPWRKAAAPLLLLAAALSFHAVRLAPLWLASPVEAAAGSRPFRVMAANVHTRNDDCASLLAAVERERPDVLILLEVDSKWRKALEPLRSMYPSMMFSASDYDNFGIAGWSRVPGSRVDIRNLKPQAPRVSDTVHILFEWEDRQVEVIGAHPVPPVSGDYVKGNLAQLDALSSYVRDAGHPCVLAGDFNRTPWSPSFRRFLREGGLDHGRAGRGLITTWPRWVPFLRIPIDHVCATRELAIASFRRLPAGGSDHNPIVAEIAPR